MHYQYNLICIEFSKDDSLLLELMNEQGEKGWELVSVIPQGAVTKLFFKRQVWNETSTEEG